MFHFCIVYNINATKNRHSMLLKNFHLSLASILVAAPLCNLLAQKKSSPNILVIMTDQHLLDALRHSGANDIIKTPNMDKLAREGAYFSQACSPCPVSGPARTSILTGRLTETTGIVTNMDSDDNKKCDYNTYDQLLTAKGYVAEYLVSFTLPIIWQIAIPILRNMVIKAQN